MSAPPPKPPKPPPKPPKPDRSKVSASTEPSPTNTTRPKSNASSAASTKTSINIDEALKESVQALSKTVFSGSEISKANLCEESCKYGNDSTEEASMAMTRLHILNNLFKLTNPDKAQSSEKSDDSSRNRSRTDSSSGSGSGPKAPLTGRLIREGYLIKKSRKSDEKVYGILTSECFAYGSEEFHVTGPPTMQMRRTLPLTMTLITGQEQGGEQQQEQQQELTEDELLQGRQQQKEQQKQKEGQELEAQFFVLSREKSFALQCSTREERQEWFTDLTAACSAAQEQAGKVFTPGEMSPVWKQDKASSKCEVCFKGFSFFFRRHHCRNCGKCVCDNCLVEKIRIPSLDPRALFKVCSACSVKLKEERNYMR